MANLELYYEYYKKKNKNLFRLPKLSKEQIKQLAIICDDKYIDKIFYLYYGYYDEIKYNTYSNEDWCVLHVLNKVVFNFNKLKPLKFLESIGLSYKNEVFYMFAIREGSYKIMKYLDSYGINIKKLINYDKYYFYLINNLKVLKHLESIGFNIHITDNKLGYNLYLNATRESDIKMLKYLESRGINIHSYNSHNMNAFSLSLCDDNRKVIRYIKSRGINIYKKHYTGESPYMMAKNYMYSRNNLLLILALYICNKTKYVIEYI